MHSDWHKNVCLFCICYWLCDLYVVYSSHDGCLPAIVIKIVLSFFYLFISFLSLYLFHSIRSLNAMSCGIERWQPQYRVSTDETAIMTGKIVYIGRFIGRNQTFFVIRILIVFILLLPKSPFHSILQWPMMVMCDDLVPFVSYRQYTSTDKLDFCCCFLIPHIHIQFIRFDWIYISLSCVMKFARVNVDGRARRFHVNQFSVNFVGHSIDSNVITSYHIASIRSSRVFFLYLSVGWRNICSHVLVWQQ